MKKFVLLLSLFLLTSTPFVSFTQVPQQKTTVGEEYVCMPCGRDCDNATYEKEGDCSHCKMRLVKRSSIVFDSIQPSEVCAYLTANPDVVLLDVRTKEEFEGKANPDFGHLKNAVNIPIQQLDKRLSELKPYKAKQIIVYCSHSRRSPQASYLLTQNGFARVINMAGGMSKWESSVKPDCKEE